MLVYGVSASQVETVVRMVADEWDGNVQVKTLCDKSNGKGARASYTLRAVRSRRAGARESASGRATVASCWHVHRDVLKRIFDVNPDARVVSGLGDRSEGKFKRVTYNGRDGFERDFPSTAHINVGSEWFPRYIGELCDCGA